LKRAVSLDFDEFGWTALQEEAERQGVSIEELLEHAALYYLSDLDSGRVAAKILKRADIDAPGAPAEGESEQSRRFGRPGEPEPEQG
jgi:hypothetical protein